MIIEIKDIPDEQLIDKIDIHIDFQKNVCKVNTVKIEPKTDEKPSPNIDIAFCNRSDVPKDRPDSPIIPDEMVNGDF